MKKDGATLANANLLIPNDLGNGVRPASQNDGISGYAGYVQALNWLCTPYVLPLCSHVHILSITNKLSAAGQKGPGGSKVVPFG